MSSKHVHIFRIPEPCKLMFDTPEGRKEAEDAFRISDLIKLVLSDRRFNDGRESWNQANELEDLFGKTDDDDDQIEPGTDVQVPEKIWKKVCDVLEKPQFGQRGDLGYNHELRQISDWIDDWCNAPKTTRIKAKGEGEQEAQKE